MQLEHSGFAPAKGPCFTLEFIFLARLCHCCPATGLGRGQQRLGGRDGRLKVVWGCGFEGREDPAEGATCIAQLNSQGWSDFLWAAAVSGVRGGGDVSLSLMVSYMRVLNYRGFPCE
ncbi:unnamed protein product [Lepidochelys olivacea]